MGLGTAIVCASLTTIMYISLTTRFSPKSLYFVNGYNVIIDLVFTFLIVGMSAATGTLTALLISALTGVMLSVSLIIMNRYLGNAKFKRIKGSWFKFKIVINSPKSKLPNCLQWVHNYLPTVDQAYAR